MANRACMLCTKKTDDSLYLGKKSTFDGMTAHHFCLLLSAEIKQSGRSTYGIFGYTPKDIKKEMKRTKETTCYICKKNGANIRCCKKSCQLSFHLTCGILSGCQNQFSGRFKSYCKSHIKIDEPTYIHKSDDLCSICFDKMGKYHPINSIQSPCCSKNAWYHKQCLMSHAKSSGKSTKCPFCNNSDLFCQTILNRGIYIPEKRPSWQEYDPFYDSLQQFVISPSCSAEKCLCWRGRRYEPATSGRKFSFIYCQCCGAKAIHRKCFLEQEIFTCDDCEIFLHSRFESIHEIQMDNNDKHSLAENDKIDSHVMHPDQRNENQNNNFLEFNIKPLSIVLDRLRPSQIQKYSHVTHSDQRNENQTNNFPEFNIKPLSIVLDRLRPSQIQKYNRT